MKKKKIKQQQRQNLIVSAWAKKTHSKRVGLNIRAFVTALLLCDLLSNEKQFIQMFQMSNTDHDGK